MTNNLGTLGKALLLLGFDKVQVGQAFGEVRGHVTGMLHGLQAQTNNLWQGILTPAGILQTAGITIGLGTAINAAKDFNQAMTESLAIQGELSEEMQKNMEDAAKKVARETTVSATNAAKAYYYLGSAGMDAAQQLGAMPQVAMFAQAAQMTNNLEEATEQLMDTQSALGMKSADAATNTQNMVFIMDSLTKASIISNGTISQVTDAMANRGAAAFKTLNKPLKESLAFFSVLADRGIKGRRAGEFAEIFFRDLQRGAVTNADAYKKFGISVFDANGKVRHSADVIEDLTRVLVPMDDATRTATMSELGITDTLQGLVKQVLGTSDAMRKYEQQLTNVSGATKEIAEKQLKSFSSRLQLVQNKLEILAIAVGGPLLDALLMILEPLAKLAEMFVALDDATDGWVGKLTALAIAIGAVNFALRSLTGSSILAILGKAIMLTQGWTKALWANYAAQQATSLAKPFIAAPGAKMTAIGGGLFKDAAGNVRNSAGQFVRQGAQVVGSTAAAGAAGQAGTAVAGTGAASTAAAVVIPLALAALPAVVTAANIEARTKAGMEEYERRKAARKSEWDAKNAADAAEADAYNKEQMEKEADRLGLTGRKRELMLAGKTEKEADSTIAQEKKDAAGPLGGVNFHGIAEFSRAIQSGIGSKQDDLLKKNNELLSKIAENTQPEGATRPTPGALA